MAARSSSSPAVAPPPKAPLPAASSSEGGGGGRLHCNYCGKKTQVEAFCFNKKKDRSRRGGSDRSSQGIGGAGGSGTRGSQRSSVGSETHEILILLRCLTASTPSGAAGYVTQSFAQSDAATASQSSSGTLPWILDSSASFHMTPDRISLSSISPSSLPVTVQTADGSSLSLLQGRELFCLPLLMCLLFLMFPN